MSDETITFITPDERNIYQEYERRREGQVIRIIAPLFGIIDYGMSAVLITYFAQQALSPTAHLILVLCEMPTWIGTAIVLWGIRWVRQGRIRLAVTTHLVSMHVLIVFVIVPWAFLLGVDGFVLILLTALSSFIGLTAVLTVDERAIIGSAAVLAVFDALILSTAPLAVGFGGIAHQRWLLILLAIAVGRGAPTTIFLAFARTYRITLRELGDTRIAVERARQLDQLKDQFISSVNHELRNPIMAMMNYVAILVQRHDTLSSPRREEFLTRLQQTGRRVMRLVTNILDVRRQEHAAFTPTVVPVLATIRAAADLIDPDEARMVERDLRLHIPADLTIWGDEVYVQQIFTNLLSNAVKYSAPGTPIEVRGTISVATSEGSKGKRGTPALASPPMAEITVRDWGLGVPPEQAPLLFQRFVRLPRDLTSRTMGNGLGLYLCRLQVETMHGQIWLESAGREGEGTTFHVRLPLPTAQTVASEPSDQSLTSAAID